MAKKQPVRWSQRRAHRLVQIRVSVLERGLQDVFRRGYLRVRLPLGREATPT